ncbi:Phosphatidic acid-preferring phospholipase A1, contains DDHD domain [Ceraceosorus bombacis]|uniref:Phosphatidic acid-preferring phospholipase A1, contains DDHD domain n=1 Tax=Ceraceosorus bombacis TaxID=401625 RepID=A0A0P1B897_9BASI|nr:Phosphatidic acid-preferring phospholipase A1, contains DDHD domain [Ceraceosorus bombacis]
MSREEASRVEERNVDGSSSCSPPDVRPRWFYSSEKSWIDFDERDQQALEARFQQLGGAEWHSEIKAQHTDGDESESEHTGTSDDDDDEAQGPSLDARKGEQDSTKPDNDEQNGLGSMLTGLISGNASDQKSSDASRKLADQAKSIPPIRTVSHNFKKAKKGSTSKEPEVVRAVLDPDEPEEESRARVAVLEDRLFDVNLESMDLYPVFWKGVKLRVVRATWFYSAASDGGYAPIAYDEALARDLDNAYTAVKPWQKLAGQEIDVDNGSTQDRSKQRQGDEVDDDELYELPSLKAQGRVHFESPVGGRIFTEDLSGRLLSMVGGSRVIRGFDEAERLAKAGGALNQLPAFTLPFAKGSDPDDEEQDAAGDEDERVDGGAERRGARHASKRAGAASRPGKPSAQEPESANSGNEESGGFMSKLVPSSGWLRPDVALLRTLGYGEEDAEREAKRDQRQKNTEDSAKTGTKRKEEEDNGDSEEEEAEEDRKDEPPSLVLCIHGIGQGLVEDFDALDFVYDVERLRKQAKSSASDPALKRLSRGRRAQFIPISWRQGLTFQSSNEQNDNEYGLSDISNSAAIPLVRNVISKVILDVPYYLSHHREKMIAAVKSELNRTYRLWCKRNPDFLEKGGRVSMICHSLGSALAMDILSQQPTTVAPLHQRSEEELRSNEHLVFDVANLFLIGSPCGFFLHLGAGQLIARRGTKRTRDVAGDAALEEAGRYGCLAAEAVYNCYNTTDPVAYQLNATVDRDYASLMRPVSIPDATDALLDSLSLPRLSVSKLFDPDRPFSSGEDAYAKANVQPTTSAWEEDQKRKGKGGASKKGKSEESKLANGAVIVEQGETLKKMQPQMQARQAGRSAYPVDVKRLEKAERRFRALNPHGAIDFFFETKGFNEYLDMLSAHVSYWTSPSFSRFVLSQLWTDYAGPESKRQDASEQEPPPTIVPQLDVDVPKEREEEQSRQEKQQT